MQSKRKHLKTATKAEAIWLTLTLHVDAARIAPVAWATALWWRILGKKVRANAQFAPLLAASPKAYRKWLLTEPKRVVGSEGDSPPIVALVAAGEGQQETIESLAGQGATAIALGTVATADLPEAIDRIDWSACPWLMPLKAGDIVAHDAVAVYRAAAARTGEDIVYADEDIIDTNGRRAHPHFKPAWNSELFRHFDYLTGSSVVRGRREDLAGLTGGDWAAEFLSRVAARGAPQRLPYVLHHRRSRPQPRVQSHSETQPPGLATTGGGEWPSVCVIVPTRNGVELLRTCFSGLERTDYPDLQVIVVDNGSDDPETLAYLDALDKTKYQLLRHPGPFNFSTLNNRAARLATSELLCLLNNDIEIVDTGWLKAMVRPAMRPEVGAVGARLLYPNGLIQHAGVVMGICGGAGHAHRFLRPDEDGYFQRHSLPQFVSAVTAACLVVRRESFNAVGGLDEENFAVAFNDVDFCMRLNAQGWQSLYEPRATLIHHESVSRGFDRDPVGAARFAGELAALKSAWKTDADPSVEIDPWHHPQLDRYSEQFVVKLRDWA